MTAFGPKVLAVESISFRIVNIRILAIFGVSCSPLLAFANPVNTPSGSVVELHSCEVYTGGCVASSQATSSGRSLLRVWSFDSGRYNGEELAGLQVALLQVARANLAFEETLPTKSIIYLPSNSSSEQKEAILLWLKESDATLSSGSVEEKESSIRFEREGHFLSVEIGETATIKAQSWKSCRMGSCGESLWYEPKSKTAAFRVFVNNKSSVKERALSLLWKDHGTSSVFFGRFGELENEALVALGEIDEYRL